MRPPTDPVAPREPTPLVVPPVTRVGPGVRLEPLAAAHVPLLASLIEPEIFEFMSMELRTGADVEASVA